MNQPPDPNGPPGPQQLLDQVYDALRQIARRQLAKERKGHTLQATALVHEAYLRLAKGEQGGPASTAQFYRLAAQAMRRILIEHARRKARPCRGGEMERHALEDLEPEGAASADNLLAVDEAIQRLEAIDPTAAEVVRMRYYAGLSVDETADALKLSPRTVAREWTYARAWLHRSLAGE